MIENGKNNGSLYLSVRDAADRLGLSDQKATMRAFDDLLDRGLIVCTKEAHFEVKAADQSRARCWALTWLARDRKGPTNEWESYRAPAKTRARRRADRGLKAQKRYLKAQTSHRLPDVDSTAVSPSTPVNAQVAVEESSAPKSKNGGKPRILIAANTSAHTAVTITAAQGSWWQDKNTFAHRELLEEAAILTGCGSESMPKSGDWEVRESQDVQSYDDSVAQHLRCFFDCRHSLSSIACRRLP